MDLLLTQLPATKLAALMRAREVSPVEVMEAHLRRIEELNPRLNAIVTLAPDALACARRAESALMRGDAGVLHGLPLTVKDTCETRGLRATSGTRLRADFTASVDAPAVACLRAAGAIVLGKTNTSELALDYTAENPLYGRTNNPHAPERTPGGSSGGCAAAVAACLTPASLGSDLVGSIRIPAHFCGVCGLRPTTGRVPTVGHFPSTDGPFSLGASIGPLARSVSDLELLYGVLAGDETMTARAGDESMTARATSPARDDDGFDVRGWRVACYADDGIAPVTVETEQAVERAAHALARAGLDVRHERPPHVEQGQRLWLELFAPATRQMLRAEFAGREDAGGPSVRMLLERRSSAPEASLADYFRAWTERDRLRGALVEWMKETPLLVAPVGAAPAFAHGARTVSVGAQELSIFRAFSYAQTCNTYDLPAVAVPAGQTGEGLPVGVQIIGRPRAERSVLAAARIVEAALGGWQRPHMV
ncbi:MAG TPA: amidase [Pyrinomonadaceae bacterium]|nr:amidase [Pyrinomonadaceae bacterium]